MKVVYVRWLDSAMDDGGWKYIKHADIQNHEVVICESVGFLLHEDKKRIQLIMNLGGFRNKELTKSGANTITIPRCSIQKIKILKK